MQMSILRICHKTLLGISALWFLMPGTASPQGTWVEELGNAVAYYQYMSPAVEWTPYIDALTRAREGLRRGDQNVVSAAMHEFESLLRANAYGIDRATAEDLYALAMTIGSPYELTTVPLSLPPSKWDRPMSVPLLKMNVQFQERVWCHEGGCDEWILDPNDG